MKDKPIILLNGKPIENLRDIKLEISDVANKFDVPPQVLGQSFEGKFTIETDLVDSLKELAYCCINAAKIMKQMYILRPKKNKKHRRYYPNQAYLDSYL